MTQHSRHQHALPPLNYRRLGNALMELVDLLVFEWLPGGKKEGHEYKCGSLSGGKGTSCSVNMRTGAWADFATDEKGGDLISLYAAIHSMGMADAAIELARSFGFEDEADLVMREGRVLNPIDHNAPPSKPAPAAAPQQPQMPAKQAQAATAPLIAHKANAAHVAAPAAPAVAANNEEVFVALTPVPEFAPKPTFAHFKRDPSTLTHTFEYRYQEALHGYVVRFRTSDGGKDTLPYTFCKSLRDGTMKWHWKTWGEPRPLYVPSKQAPQSWATVIVVVVEGERKADVLQAFLDAHAPHAYWVVSWPGGSKVWNKADWAWIKEARNVLLWPDCDAQREKLTVAEQKGLSPEQIEAAKEAKPYLPEHKQPGHRAMIGIGHELVALGVHLVRLLRIPAVGETVSGWDAADAIETDKWTFEQVQALFNSAYALPPSATDTPAAAPAAIAGGAAAVNGGSGGGGGKKIEGLADAEEESGGLPWWLRPYFDAEKSRWLTSRKMVITALTHDPALEGILGVDQLSMNIVARRPWPWVHGHAGEIRGETDLRLGQYLSKTYGISSINRSALTEAIETVAHENPFHPIQEWLAGLSWDGRERVDKWLVHCIGEDKNSLTPQMYEYICLVGRFWLLAMVYRVMQPGCKFDYCTVLEGPGGLGKSTLVEALAGSKWFSDTHFDISRGKEGQEQVSGLWAYEIAELSQFGKAEIQLIKAFISAKVDRYRPSYGRVVQSYPRQCVMVGTTNEKAYLRDRTGNRRFWPVPIRHRVNIPWIQERREQLFAEAYMLYNQGAAYTPSPDEEKRFFVQMQESRLVETAVMGELLEVLTRKPRADAIGALVNEYTDFVTLPLLIQALGVDAAKSSPALESQVRGWLEHEGWVKVKRQVEGVRKWGWERPKNWPAQDDDDAGVESPPVGSDEDALDAPF